MKPEPEDFNLDTIKNDNKSLERKNNEIINDNDEVEKTICGIEQLSINDIADRSNNNELMDTNYSSNRDLEEDYYSHHSSATEDWSDSDHEECLESEYQPQTVTAGDSSEEDWDSDSYWEPQYVRRHTTLIESPWIYYIKKKMSEGNFCPMDFHTVPVIEQVKYLKRINPRSPGFVEGQFDDLSDDES